jgi:DNA-binding response OmpR family regulator
VQLDASWEDLLLMDRLEIRPGANVALIDGRALHLTRLELRLLTELARRPNQVLERPEIYRAVWAKEMEEGDRWVDFFVRRVRSKLHAAQPGTEYIHTHWGIGYRFYPERSRDVHNADTRS